MNAAASSAGTTTDATPVSFVIPARNEERYITATIESIRAFGPTTGPNDIVVVDNGSTDRTVELAREAGATVISQQGTVAALRNAGVLRTSGRILVFLDADVLLTAAWRVRIDAVLQRLQSSPDTVTGSRCGISRERSWIERAWFAPLLGERANYINSGHLITTRTLFDRIGGFDATRETGEDSDFSQRARAAGAQIVNDPLLEVIHEGYPKTLAQFFRRERWHGRGNFLSWTTIRASRIAPLTLLFVAAHAVALGGAIAGSRFATWGAMLWIATICIASALAKYRARLDLLPVAGYLYYWYYAARSLALFDVLRAKVVAGARPVRHHR